MLNRLAFGPNEHFISGDRTSHFTLEIRIVLCISQREHRLGLAGVKEWGKTTTTNMNILNIPAENVVVFVLAIVSFVWGSVYYKEIVQNETEISESVDDENSNR